MAGHGLVVQMPMGQIAPGLGERAEIRKLLHGGDAREFLAEVVGVAAAVVRGMQQPVNVVEQVFMIKMRCANAILCVCGRCDQIVLCIQIRCNVTQHLMKTIDHVLFDLKNVFHGERTSNLSE